MSNKKSKDTRRQERIRSSPPYRPQQPQYGLSSRLKAIGLRAFFFAIFLAISGLGITAYRKYINPPKALHEFDATERASFIAALKAGGVSSQSVWLACPDGKPEICRLVKQFVSMFQEAGWKVEGNQVIQWKPAHPLGGVYLILHTGGPDNSTPAEAAGVKNSFTAIGIPVQSAAAPDVPKNSIGVFFGPDL